MSTVCGRSVSQMAAMTRAASTGATRSSGTPRRFGPAGSGAGGGGGAGSVRGGAATVDICRSTAGRLPGHEFRHPLDDLRTLEPRPVAGALDRVELAAQHVRVRAPELER